MYMAHRNKISDSYKQRFLGATRRFRELADISQSEAAYRLGLAHRGLSGQQARQRYEYYENKSLLRHDLILPYCEMVGITPDQLFQEAAKGTRRSGVRQSRPTRPASRTASGP